MNWGPKHGVKKHLSFGNLRLNLESLEVFHQSVNLKLTPIEFKILAALVNNYPENISRENLIQTAWNSEIVLDRTVNTHLTNLRSKLPKNELSIECCRGTGILLRRHSYKPISKIVDSQSIMVY